MKTKLITLFCTLSSLFAFAQTKNTKFTGTYELVTVDNILADGSRIHLYGDKPQGLLIFDDRGRYALQIYSVTRPKFAANDKSKGTGEENRALVKGSNAHFGSYIIDEANGAIIFNIEHATFPNWEGAMQKRPFTLIGNVFQYTVPAPTTGGTVTGEVVWKKVE